MKRTTLLTAALLSLSPMGFAPVPHASADVVDRPQQVRPLPGSLDSVLMVNDNNPELIREEGILLSTFPASNTSGLQVTLDGRFDLFSHHVYAGNEDSLDSTLWLAVLAAPTGDSAVTLKLLEGSTSLSQALHRLAWHSHSPRAKLHVPAPLEISSSRPPV